MKLKLPVKENFKSALKLNRWPVNWFNEKKDKEDERAKSPQIKVTKQHCVIVLTHTLSKPR